MPPAQGEARLSGGVYTLTFPQPRDHYELTFRIDTATWRGTRELFDDEAQAIRGHGGFDEISCKPHRDSP